MKSGVDEFAGKEKVTLSKTFFCTFIEPAKPIGGVAQMPFQENRLVEYSQFWFIILPKNFLKNVGVKVCPNLRTN